MEPGAEIPWTTCGEKEQSPTRNAQIGETRSAV
jgi:hypothetical protein